MSRMLASAFSAAMAAMFVASFAAPRAVADPPVPLGADGGDAGAAWTATHDGPQRYAGVHIDWDVPIRMSDGVVLKANVYRPMDAQGRIVAEPTPTILDLTPYTKLIQMMIDSALSIPGLSEPLEQALRTVDFGGTPFSGITDLTKGIPSAARNFSGVDPALIRSGYTQVVVDVRGTVFSQGIWDGLRQREQQDSLEVIDWAAAQPWSDGRVGMSGMSYSAINQLEVAQQRPPAHGAIFPVDPDSDLDNDAVQHGGSSTGWLPLWRLAPTAGKLLPDLMSIGQGRFDWQWLADRAASSFTFLDLMLDTLVSLRISDMSPELLGMLAPDGPARQAWRGQVDRIEVPTFVVGGWNDVFSYAQPRIYRDLTLEPGRKQLLMSDSYHFNVGADFGKPVNPPRIEVLQQAWFDKWLKGIDNGIDHYGPLMLRQQGAGWSSTPEFPRPGVTHRRMYLSATPSGTAATSLHDGSLTTEPTPESAQLTVAPGVMSICSPATAQMTAGVSGIIVGCTKDARPQELNGLSFTSAAVAEPTLISGPISVHLDTAYDAADGFWVVTVNDVAPDGQSTVLTAGQLVASLRAIDDARNTRSPGGDYTDPVPVLSMEQRRPTVPGEPVQLDIAAAATDAVLQPGHRLRVDVYASNFPRSLPATPLLVDSGLRPQHLLLDPAEPSFVNIPIGGTPGW